MCANIITFVQQSSKIVKKMDIDKEILLPELRQKLYSDQNAVVSSTLELIRQEGLTELLPEVIELIDRSKSDNIKNKAIALLNDVKDPQACRLFVEVIQNSSDKQMRIILIAACWQSGLDFSDHLQFFVDLVSTSDYPTAIEAFSVIEHCTENVAKATRQAESKRLKEIFFQVSAEKQTLLQELIYLFDNH